MSHHKSHAGLKLLGLATAAAAGAYFLYGKNGARNRRKVKGWMLKAQGEILERLENMAEVSEKAYREVVDAVAKKYKGLEHVDARDLTALASEAKKQWTAIRRGISSAGRPASRKKKGVKKRA